MKMKYFFLFISLFSLRLPASAQSGVYLGAEFGNKRDYYNFSNSEGSSVTHGILTDLYGIYAGYSKNRYALESGIYLYNSLVPEITWDEVNERPFFGKAAHSTNANSTWVIPLRIGYDFTGRRKSVYLQPFLGVMLIMNDVEKNSRMVSWARIEDPEGSSGGQMVTGDSLLPVPDNAMFSHGIGYSTTPLNIGVQGGFSIGYRFKKRLDIYMKFTAHSSFSLLYFENVQYQYDSGPVTGTTTFQGSSTAIQLGVKYFLRKEKPDNIYQRP
jgi:hypothetical protein